MNLGEFSIRLQDLLRDLFFQSYGDRIDSQSGDRSVTGRDWTVISSSSNGGIFYFRNQSDEEVQLSWNRENAVGMRVAPDEALLMDNVSGVAYAKPSDPNAVAIINFGFVAKKMND
jgi:hypothetical protein